MCKVENEDEVIEEHEAFLKCMGFWKRLWCRYLIKAGLLTKEQANERADD